MKEIKISKPDTDLNSLLLYFISTAVDNGANLNILRVFLNVHAYYTCLLYSNTHVYKYVKRTDSVLRLQGGLVQVNITKV